MKPEVGNFLFAPLFEQMREKNISPPRGLVNPEAESATGPKDQHWIDEVTFREWIAILRDNGQDDHLLQAGLRLLHDESRGLGEVLLPFLESPYELLEVLTELINQNARTLRATLSQTDKHTATFTLISTQSQTELPVLGDWVEGLLRAAQLESPAFTYVKEDQTLSGTAVPSDAHRAQFEIRWKRPRHLSGRKAIGALRQGTGKARRIIGQHQQSLLLLDTRLKEQEALLQGIVSLSEDTKVVKDYRHLIHSMASRLCTDFGFDRSEVYLARDGMLEIAAVIDVADSTWAQTIFTVCQDHPIPIDDRTEEAKAFQAGKPVIVANPWNNIFVPQAQQEAWKSRGYAIVPIAGADRVIGLILADHYYSRRPIDQDDIDRLQTVAVISGMAVEKLRLIDRLEGKVKERTIELERVNKRLMSMYARARESDQLKSDFLANMSHELRTPLNSIIGFSKLIIKGIDGPLNEKQSTDLTAILNSGTHLLGLINDVLDLSKIESGKMELKIEEFNLNLLVQEVLAQGKALIKDKPITLEAKSDAKLGKVFGDRLRLNQVLLNLVSNSIKFTEKGSITISTKAGKDEYYIAVTDTGQGMPADKIDQAFERFRQLDSSTSRTKGGSGLGLTISKKFVEMHGGRIWVTSTEGVGSTFHISIPINSNKETPPQSTEGKKG